MSVIATVYALLPLTRTGDQAVFAYVGEGIIAGEVPFLDRWDHKGPLTYVIYALGLIVPGWWGLWTINLTFLFGSLWLAFRIVVCLFGAAAALCSVATLLIYVLMHGNRLGSIEHYAMLFQFLALFLFLRSENSGRPRVRDCLAIGALGALSFLLRPNLIGVWLAIGIFWAIRWPQARSTIFWSVIGGVSVLVAVSIAFLSLGAWTEYLDATIVYNLLYSDATMSDRVQAAKLLVSHLLPVAPFLGVAWCIGTWSLITGKAQSAELERIWPFILILGPIEVALIMISGYGSRSYILSVLPVGVLYLGFLVWFIPMQKLVTLAFLTFLLLFATSKYHMDIYVQATDTWRMVRGTAVDRGEQVRDKDQQVTELVKSISTPEDTILVWGHQAKYYLLAKRDSPTRFFYQSPLANSAYAKDIYLKEFISDVTSGRPAVIIDIRDRRLPPLDEADRKTWQPHQRFIHDPAKFQRLFNFVKSDYELLAKIDEVRVYRLSN